MDPPADAPLPIAQLEPGLDTAHTSVRGVVTLVWPYSASRRSFSVLLVEPDFRLRRNKGQVRVTFKRACAKALARAGVASGDEVRLQLTGCKWLEEDASSLQTPGRSAGWELGFDREVHLEIRRPDTAVKTINIERTSSPEPLRPFTPPPPRTPVDHASPISPISVLSTTSTWSTPAFLRKKKRNLSSVLASSSSYDFLDDENATAEQPTKKFKLSHGSRKWRVAARSPSPEQPEPSSSEPKRTRFQLPDEPATQGSTSKADEPLEETLKPTSPAKPKSSQPTQESELQSSSDLFGPPLIPKLSEALSRVTAAPPPPDQETTETGQTDQQDLHLSFSASRNDAGSLQDSFESSGQVTPSFPPDDHPAAMMTFGSGFTEHSSPFSQRPPASQARRRTENAPLLEDLGQTFLEGIMPIAATQDFADRPQHAVPSHADEQTGAQARTTNGAEEQQEDYSSHLVTAPTGDRRDRRDVISFDFASNVPYNPPGGRRPHHEPPAPVPVSMPPLGISDTFIGLTSSPTSTQTPGLNNTFFNFESFGDGTDNLATITFDMSTIPGPQDLSDVPITPPEQSLLHYPHLSGVLRSPNVGGRPPSQAEVSQALAQQKIFSYQGQDDQDDPTISQDVESIVTEVIDSSQSDSLAQNQDNPQPATTTASNAETEVMSEEGPAAASPRKALHSSSAAAPPEQQQQQQQATDDVPEQPAPVRRSEPEVIELSSGDEASDSEEEELPAAPSRADQDHLSESDGVEAAALSEDENEESQETEVMSDEDVDMRYDQTNDAEDSGDSDDINDDGAADDSDDSNEPADNMRYEREMQAANTALTVDDDAKSDSTQVLEPVGERSESPTLTEDLEIEAEVVDDDQVAAATTATTATTEHLELSESKRIAEEDDKDVSALPDVSVTVVESASPVEAIEIAEVEEPETVEPALARNEIDEDEESIATTEEITTPDVATALDEAVSDSGEIVEPTENAEEASFTQRALEPEVPSVQVDVVSGMHDARDEEALSNQSQISRHVDEVQGDEVPVTSGLEEQQDQSEQQQTSEAPPSPRKVRQTRSQKPKPQPQPRVRTSRWRNVASPEPTLPVADSAAEPPATEDPVEQETEPAPRRVSKRKRAVAETEPEPAPSRVTRQRRKKQPESEPEPEPEPEPQPEEASNDQPEEVTAMPEQQAQSAKADSLANDSTAIPTTKAAQQPATSNRPARSTRQSKRKVSFQSSPSQEAAGTAAASASTPTTSSTSTNPRPDPVSAQLFAELASENPSSASAPAPPLTSLPITQGTRTKNAYYTPLPNLHEHVNSQVDAACLIAGVSPADRAPSGPRDWHMTLYVTDAGLISTSSSPAPGTSSGTSTSNNASGTLPSNGSYLRTVQIFRPNRSALPRATSPGDVLVLHNFRCQTRARRPMLLSTAQSGWVVFDGAAQPAVTSSSPSSAGGAAATNPRSRQQRRQPASASATATSAPASAATEASASQPAASSPPPRAKQTGPPIDYTAAELHLASSLRAWWTSTVTASQRKTVVAHAAAARDQARELARRRSGRKRRAAPGEVTHELRNGSRYPYTDSVVLGSDEVEAETAE